MASALLATAGRPLARRGLALAAAVFVPAAIVFAPNGLRPSDLVHQLHADASLRVALFVAWCALATPAAAVAFDAPGTRTLRSIARGRASRALVVAMLVALLAVLVEGPWAALFARGGGTIEALEATALAIAAQTTLAALTVPTAGGVGRAAAVGALVVVDPRPAVAVLPALVLAWLAVDDAWRRGPERGLRADPRGLLRWTTRPAVALVLVHLARLARVERARLAVAAAGASAGGAALALTVANDPPERPVHRALGLLTLPACAAAATIASPLLEVEARLAPWVRAARARHAAVVAFVVAVCLPTSALAATATAVATAPDLVPVAAVAAWSAALGLAIAAWARRAATPVRLVLGAIGVAVAGLAAVLAC